MSFATNSENGSPIRRPLERQIPVSAAGRPQHSLGQSSHFGNYGSKMSERAAAGRPKLRLGRYALKWGRGYVSIGYIPLWDDSSHRVAPIQGNPLIFGRVQLSDKTPRTFGLTFAQKRANAPGGAKVTIRYSIPAPDFRTFLPNRDEPPPAIAPTNGHGVTVRCRPDSEQPASPLYVVHHGLRFFFRHCVRLRHNSRYFALHFRICRRVNTPIFPAAAESGFHAGQPSGDIHAATSPF